MTAPNNQNKYSKYTFLIIVLVSLLALSYALKNPLGNEGTKLPYGEFLDKVDQKQIKKVTIVNQSNRLTGEFTDGKKFIVDAPNDQNLVKTLHDRNVSFSAENPGLKENVMQFLAMIIVPVLLIVAIWFLIMRQAQMGGSQAMSFGRSRAKKLSDNMPQVTFADVAGVDEAVEELSEIVEFLKDPKKFQTLGAKIPKGVLLLGPPGSGKTLLARAIAGEAKVPFFHMSGSDFVEMFVGVGASRVRDLFDQAKHNAPCLVFVDEIDAVGRQRGAGLGGGHDEREQTLNQLLVEMDGFDANIGVILLAATNRPDVLDPALLRPGRFDRRVIVDSPDLNGRRAILDVHARNKPIDPSVDLDVIARRTPGFTGADLENVLNEAAILAARDNSSSISLHHIEESIDRNIAGPERRSRLLSERDKKVTAFHEAGHALVARLIPDTDPVHKISILPRGMALGYTLQLPSEDKYTMPRSELLNEICVLLGGRVAEKIIFDDITTGASNDIERATKIARKMVTRYGMSDELGPLTFGRQTEAVFLGRDFSHERDYSEEVASKIDQEVHNIIARCFERVEKLLLDHRSRLDLVAEQLMIHEFLEGSRLESLLDGNQLSDEDIDLLEAARKKSDEEKNRVRREAKEAGVKKKQDDLAAAGQAETDKVMEEPAAAKAAVPAELLASDDELISAGGLLSQFYFMLDKIFRDTIAPFAINEKVRSQLERMEKVIAESKSDFAMMMLQQLIRESEDRAVEAGFRIRLALLHVRDGHADRVAEELLSALNTGDDRLEKNAKGILISAISYFRIFNEELKKNKIPYPSFIKNSAVLEKIDSRYMEWEKKARSSSGDFPHIS
jgi:cell division protease FtsH